VAASVEDQACIRTLSIVRSTFAAVNQCLRTVSSDGKYCAQVGSAAQSSCAIEKALIGDKTRIGIRTVQGWKCGVEAMQNRLLAGCSELKYGAITKSPTIDGRAIDGSA